MLLLRTFGRIELTASGGSPVRALLVQPKRTALLVYLAAVPPNGYVRRSSLLPLFWPESDEPAARHSLSQALYKLKVLVGCEVIELRGEEELRLVPDTLKSDLAAFRTAVEGTQWSEALRLMDGEFLSGLELSGADGFERWLDDERERLRRAGALAAWSLTTEQLRDGTVEDAERSARRALDLDPVNEPAVRRLMKGFAARGALTAAANLFETFRERLGRDLEMEPSAETTALARSLCEARAAPVTPDSLDAPASPVPAPDETIRLAPEEPAAGVHDSPRRRITKALLAYLLTAALAVTFAGLSSVFLDVPDWVLPSAIIVMGLGVPCIMLVTVRRRSPQITWRQIAVAGGATASILASTIAADAAMRRAGIGPSTSLLSAGTLSTRRPMLVTDFDVNGADSAWGRALGTAVRTSIGESRTVSVFSPVLTADALERMQRPRSARLDMATALEVARREGVPAILDGSVDRTDAGFLLTLRLIATDSAQLLASYSETAESEQHLIRTIDRLARRMRGRIGESMARVRSSAPLPHVLTADLRALLLYDEGARANDVEGDFEKAVSHLEEAVRLDPGFASAWRKLSAARGNLGGLSGDRSPGAAAAQAFEHRDRISPVERALIEGQYFATTVADLDRALDAYRRAFILSDSTIGTNFGDLLWGLGALEEAVVVTEAQIAHNPSAIAMVNLVRIHIARGDLAAATSANERFHERHPESWVYLLNTLFIEYHRDVPARFRALLDSVDALGDPRQRRRLDEFRSALAFQEGRPEAARRYVASPPRTGRIPHDRALRLAIAEAQWDLFFLRDAAAARARLDRALSDHPLDSIQDPAAHPLAILATALAAAGRPEQAKPLLLALEQRLRGDSIMARRAAHRPHEIAGEIALAEGRFDQALEHFRSIRGSALCSECPALRYARVFERSGEVDSAIHWYSAYLRATGEGRLHPDRDGLHRSSVLERLSELHEQRGDTADAAHYAAKVLSLWRNAEPPFHERARALRARLVRLGRRDDDRAEAPSVPRRQPSRQTLAKEEDRMAC